MFSKRFTTTALSPASKIHRSHFLSYSILLRYPIIISIENHCSAEQRVVMARMFVEIFGGKGRNVDEDRDMRFYWVDSLIQSPLSANETRLPSPNQLKRKIILKVSLLNANRTRFALCWIFSSNIRRSFSLGLERQCHDIVDISSESWILRWHVRRILLGSRSSRSAIRFHQESRRVPARVSIVFSRCLLIDMASIQLSFYGQWSLLDYWIRPTEESSIRWRK